MGKLLRRFGERAQVVETGAPALGVARAQRRQDERLEQAGLAVGSRPERAQVPRCDAVARKPLAQLGDLDVQLRVRAPR